MNFSVRLPNGQIRPFVDAAVFAAYLAQWPRDQFYFHFTDKCHCQIQSLEAPF